MKWFSKRMAPRHVTMLTALAMIVATANSARSQVWERKYGPATADDYGYSATPIKNDPAGAGGYVEVGRTFIATVNGGHDDVYVVKADNNGTTVWQKTYDFGGGTNDVAMSVYECANGDLLVAGTTGDQPAAGICNKLATDNIFLMRLEPDGDLRWARTYGGMDTEGESFLTNMKVIETAVSPNAGDIVIATSTQSFGNGPSRTSAQSPDAQLLTNRDGYLLRTDADGVLRWGKAFGVPAPLPTCFNCPQVGIDEYFTSVAEGENGDLIAVGTAHLDINGSQEYPWVVRTTADGNLNPTTFPSTFTRAYMIVDAANNVLKTRIYSVREGRQPANRNNIIMAGACDLLEAGGGVNTELYVLSVVGTQPQAGTPMANLTCGDFGTGTTGLDEGRDIIETASGQYVALGTTTNLGAPGRGSALYAVNLTQVPNPLPPPLSILNKNWSRTYGDAWDEQGWSVAEVDNSGVFGTPGLLFCGSSKTSSFGRNDWQMYLLKAFGTNGATQCSDVPSDVLTRPQIQIRDLEFQSCKVRVQSNRVPNVVVRTWEFDPICND